MTTYTSGAGYKKVVVSFGTLFVKSNGDYAYVHSGETSSQLDSFAYKSADASGNVSSFAVAAFSSVDSTAP